MLVKDLIKLLKSSGIKGNSELEIDCINDTVPTAVVMYSVLNEQKIVLTDDPEEVKDRVNQTENLKFEKIIELGSE